MSHATQCVRAACIVTRKFLQQNLILQRDQTNETFSGVVNKRHQLAFFRNDGRLKEVPPTDAACGLLSEFIT